MTGGTAVAVQVLATMIEGDVDTVTKVAKNSEMVNYGLVAAGLVLPEVIKSDVVATASSSLLAIGAYRLAQQFDVAGMLSINGIGSATDYRAVVGADWSPASAMRTEKETSSNNSQVVS